MNTTRMQSFRPAATTVLAAVALLATPFLAACSSGDRTENSDSARSGATPDQTARADMAPAALVEFRVLGKPPVTDHDFSAPVILTADESSDLLRRHADTIIMSPRIKVLENFSASVRVGTESGDNAMLDGISLRTRVVSVDPDAITLELSGAENRDGRRTAQLGTTTVTIPANAAAAITMPDPISGEPRFLVVSATADRADWPRTMAHAKTNIMVHYGLSEVPADAELPAIDVAPGRAVAVSHEVANTYLDRLTRVRGYRFISSPAVFTTPGDAATVSQLDTDKAGLQTDGHEMTVTVTTSSDKSLVLDMTARRRVGDAWQPLFFADDLVLRPDQTLIYIEPARDNARTRTVLIARPSAYPAGTGPRQSAAELTKQTFKQTDSVDAASAR